MNVCMKCAKNTSFVIKDDHIIDKYNAIWDKIKKIMNIKFHSMPVYDEKYMKAKVREFMVSLKQTDQQTNEWKEKELSTSLFRRMQI